MSDITLILQAINNDKQPTAEQLLPLVYEELRRLADIYMAKEYAGDSLQATALVHEAWLRLVCEGDRGLLGSDRERRK